ncbi:MAG: hypothetical protein AAGC93_17885 [Cyanobacteria bacterium P01_F01_bin.53]
MKSTLLRSLLLASAVSLPLIANAQPPLDPPTSCEQVEELIRNGSTPEVIIETLMNSGMALTGATVFAVECAGPQYRVPLAEAGVGLASNLREANGVVRAVAFAFGESSPETVAARSAFASAEKLAKQPPEYKSNYTPHGGGEEISPST